MGTTLVAMLLDGDSYHIANVGDSRAYLLSSEDIRQVSDDHSYVNEAVKQGQSESEAVASKWRNVLTRAIGTDPEVVVDLFGPFPVENDTAVLLCSDGLYKVLSDGDLQGLFVGSSGPTGAVQALVNAAVEGGSDDNISVTIAEFGEIPRDREEATVQLEWKPPDDYLRSSDDVYETSDDTSGMTSVDSSEEGSADTSSDGPAGDTEVGLAANGVLDDKVEDPGAGSAGVTTRTGPPMALIGAVAVVLLVVAYLIFGR